MGMLIRPAWGCSAKLYRPGVIENPPKGPELGGPGRWENLLIWA